MEEETTKAKDTTEKVIKLAFLPINGKNPLFLLSLAGSIGMFIIDHNGFLSIPWPIVWLPLAFCFAPIIFVLAAMVVFVVVWLAVVAALAIGYGLLMLWYGIRIAYRKIKLGAKNLFKRKSPAQ